MKSQSNGPDAPTRLAEYAMALGDHLRTLVYYLPESDVFLIVDRRAEPTPFNSVAIKKQPDDSLIIEPYFGQHYLGVVKVLEDYPFKQAPRILLQCFASILTAITSFLA